MNKIAGPKARVAYNRPPMDAAKDYYRVLGVAVDADAAAIQSAYRALAKKFHPDAPAETRSAERFIEVQEAYDVLGSRESKDAYDEARAATHAAQERRERQRAAEEAAWRAVVKQEPEIADHHADLSRLAKSLGRRYRSGILAGMDDRSPGDFAAYLEEQFLTRHFGRDPHIQRLGKTLLENAQRTAAAELAGEIRKLPERLTAEQRKDLVDRFKPKRPASEAPKAWPRFAPYVGLAFVLGLITVGIVDFLRSVPKEAPAIETAIPSFGGPQIGKGLKPTLHKPSMAVAQKPKPIDDRIPNDDASEMPETTATITRDEPPAPAVASPAKTIYDRIEAGD
ncbi:MAG: DnaJ domain-containing protein [Hyphomicrobiales bacterium]